MAPDRLNGISTFQAYLLASRRRNASTIRAAGTPYPVATVHSPVQTSRNGHTESNCEPSYLDHIDGRHLRPRLLHDIVPFKRRSDTHGSPDARNEELVSFFRTARDVFSKKSLEKFGGGVLIYREHYEEGHEHLHIVHDCTFSNATCRCAFMARFQIKPRDRKRRQYTSAMGRDDWERLTNYLLFQRERGASFIRTSDGKIFACVDNAATRLFEVCEIARPENLAIEDGKVCIGNRTELPRGSGSAENINREGLLESEEAPQGPKNFQESKVFQFLLKYLISPPDSCHLLKHYYTDRHLLNINESQKEYRNALSLYKRVILNKSLTEIHEMYSPENKIYNAINGDPFNMYFDADTSANKIKSFLTAQFNHTEGVVHFISTLYNILMKQNGKKNCLWIRGPPDSNKSTFIKIVEQLMITCGRVSIMNKTNNFPFSSCTECRLIVLDELSFDPAIYTDQLKLLLSGEPMKVSKKYCEDVYIYKTPIIAVSNGECFPSTDVFNCRIEKFFFNTTNVSLIGEKYCHPDGLLLLFKEIGLM